MSKESRELIRAARHVALLIREGVNGFPAAPLKALDDAVTAMEQKRKKEDTK